LHSGLRCWTIAQRHVGHSSIQGADNDSVLLSE
jgi:hypothetical protein